MPEKDTLLHELQERLDAVYSDRWPLFCERGRDGKLRIWNVAKDRQEEEFSGGGRAQARPPRPRGVDQRTATRVYCCAFRLRGVWALQALSSQVTPRLGCRKSGRTRADHDVQFRKVTGPPAFKRPTANAP